MSVREWVQQEEYDGLIKTILRSLGYEVVFELPMRHCVPMLRN